MNWQQKYLATLRLGFCLLFMVNTALGQQKEKDSLWQQWQNKKLEDTLRIKAVKQYIEEYLYDNPDETIKVSLELVEFAKELEDYTTVASAHNMTSRGYYFKGETKESFNYLKKAIESSSKSDDIEGTLLYKINLAIFFSENYLKPSEYEAILEEVDSVASHNKLWTVSATSKFFTILEAQEKNQFAKALRKLGELELLLNDPSITIDDSDGRLYYSLAYGYRSMENYEKSKEYYTKSIQKSNKAKKSTKIIRLVYRAEVNLLLGDTLAAIQDYKEGFEVSHELDSTVAAFAIKESNYAGGLYHYYSGNYLEAYKLLEAVLRYNQKTDALDVFSYSYLFMARIKLKNNELKEALGISKEGLLCTSDERNPEHRLEFLNNLYTINKLKGDNIQALQYYEAYTDLKEKLFNKEKTKAIAIQGAKNVFAIERQEADFNYQKNLKEERQQRKMLYAISAILIGFMTLGFLLYINRRKRKMSEREQQLQEDFTQQLLQSTEEERSRVAGDLHDSVNHKLLQLKQKAKLGKEIQYQEIGTIIDQVRTISHNLSPAMFDQVGLIKSIEGLCIDIMELNPLRIVTQLDYKETLTKKQELQVYRIVEEALNNILKHSNATHAVIEITNNISYLEVKIKDNGIGLSQNTTENEGFNFGLTNMKQRAKSIKGKLDLKSDDNGTALNLTMTV